MAKEKAVILDWVGTLFGFSGAGLYANSRIIVSELSKDYKVAILSKVPSDRLELRKEQISEMNEYIDLTIVDTYKDEKQFSECIKRLCVKPENVFVVGDRTRNEIRIGNKLGCKTIWIQKGRYENELPNEETGNPNYTISSIDEVLNIL